MVYDPTALILPEELRERETEREAKFGTQFSDHLQCQRFLNGWDNSACILDWNEHILGQLTHTSFMKCAFYHIHLLSESICIFSPVYLWLLKEIPQDQIAVFHICVIEYFRSYCLCVEASCSPFPLGAVTVLFQYLE